MSAPCAASPKRMQMCLQDQPIHPARCRRARLLFFAAAIAALVSSLAVYVIMTSDRHAAGLNPREAPATKSVVPSRLETPPSQKGSEANGTHTPADIKSEPRETGLASPSR